MEEQIELKIRDLYIWTDNPRIANGRANSEEIAIFLIYEIVGQNKMISLAESIAEFGLSRNHLPVVVFNEDNQKYDVYDGNRRIAVIKDLISKNSRLSGIKDTQNFNNDTKINVLCTSREEALRLMNLDHAGEQGGKGQIPWEAYQRDIALKGLDITCMYPEAQQVAEICGLSKKRDFIKIPYTDLDNIFKNKFIKEIWGVDEWDYSDSDFIKDVYRILIKVKPERLSYSRFLPRLKNSTKELEDFKSRINFERSGGNLIYSFELLKNAMFENEDFDEGWIILRDSDGRKINNNNIKIEYYLGNEKRNHIDRIGTWLIKIKIGEIIKSNIFTVKQIYEPMVNFSNEIFCINNTYNYTDFIDEIKNSKGENCIEDIQIKFNTEIDNNSDPKNKKITFFEPGEVIVIINFIDEFRGFQQIDKKFNINYTKNFIESASNLNNLSIIQRHILNKSSKLDISVIVNNLLLQTDELYAKGNYNETIVASSRAIIECAMFYICQTGKLEINPKLVDIITDFFQLCATDNDFLKYIATSQTRGYHDVKNIIEKYNSEDIKSLAAVLNLGAHKSMENVNIEEYNQKLPLISLIIELTSLYLDYFSAKTT